MLTLLRVLVKRQSMEHEQMFPVSHWITVQGVALTSATCRGLSYAENLHFCSLLAWGGVWTVQCAVCVEECAGGPGCSEQFPASWQHLQRHSPALEPGQERAGEAGPDGISDLTLQAATHPAFLGLAESKESLFCTMRHSKRIIMKGWFISKPLLPAAMGNDS